MARLHALTETAILRPMPKPAPYRLRPETYPFRVILPTRFADMDINWHLNNVAISTLFEEGRVRMLRALDDAPFAHGHVVVVAASFNYLHDGVYGTDVELGCGIAALGKTSWTIHGATFQNGRAFATSDVVCVRTVEGAPVPLGTLRERLETYLMPSTLTPSTQPVPGEG